MKILAATLLAMVFVTSGTALAEKKATKETAKVECSAADKKAGKCGADKKKKKPAISTAVVAPNSVRAGSADSSASRVPASVLENDVH